MTAPKALPANHHADHPGFSGVTGAIVGLMLLRMGRANARLAAEVTEVSASDRVVDIAENDKGATGEVLRVDDKTEKVVVQGVNRVYRHMRPSRRHPHGGRIQKEMPIHISNVLPVAPETSQPTRVGFRNNDNGQKERFARKSGASLGAVTKATK